MPNHPSDQAEQAIRVAALHRPQQLKSKLLIALRAFLFQHEALLDQSAKEIKAMFQCGCDECVVNCAVALSSHAEIAADLRQLSAAHDLICEVSSEFPRPEPDSMEVAATNLRERMIQACAGDPTDEARDTFERLLSHTNDTDSNAQA